MLPLQHDALHRAVERSLTHHVAPSSSNHRTVPPLNMSGAPWQPTPPESSPGVNNHPSQRGPPTHRHPAGAGSAPGPYAHSDSATPRRHRVRPHNKNNATKKVESPTLKTRPLPKQHHPHREAPYAQAAPQHVPFQSGTARSVDGACALSTEQARGLLPTSSVATCEIAFDARLIELLYCLTPTGDEKDERARVVRDVGASMRRTGMDVQIYGSLCTGLVIPASDVDCVLMTSAKPHIADSMSQTLRRAMSDIAASSNGSGSARTTKSSLSTAVRTVADRLRNDRQFTSVTCIAHAKVPIVKCRHRGGAVQVDLSFEKDGCVSSNYLCECFCEPGNEMARPLIVLIKAFIHHAGLDDPSVGGLGSFPISLMVLWFLQECVRPRFAAALQCSISVLFVGFLKYFGTEFDFQHCGIDVVQRRTFPKAAANDLFIVNPIHPGTNCARAAFQFSGRVVPLFQSAANAFAGLLSVDAPVTVMVSQLLNYFSRSIPSDGDWREVVRRALIAKRDPQNIWDTETNMYVGGVL